MLNIWTKPSNYQFLHSYVDNGEIKETVNFPERRTVDITLPTVSDLTGITFSLISGKLPGGLRLSGNKILGSTLEVSTTITSIFVIRASNGLEVSDRTFKMTVAGPDSPVWVTEEGTLAVGTASTRIAKISQISRTNNLVYIVTTRPHEFIWGNHVSIFSTVNNLNIENVELVQPPFLAGESYPDYLDRIETLIVYRKNGANVSATSATGNVVLKTIPLTFILDSSYVDYQLQAVDTDLSADDSLEFFIADDDGELPPGLSLSSSGRITGIIDPILSLDITARTGFYDTNLYDSYAYDFGERPNIGLEDFLNVVTPKKLNRNYEFIVSVTDGETIVKRQFKIFVVGDDFLRADNTLMSVGTSAFTADVTYLRSVIWLSASNLGLKRANNYVTVPLNYFDPNPAIGPVKFELEPFNDDTTPSVLPDGLFLDSTTGEIFGFVPYQPAITEEYKFTINAKKYDKENLEQVAVQIVVAEDAAYGQNFLTIFNLPAEDVALIVGDTIRIGPTIYTITEYIPPALNNNRATLKLKENLITNVFDGFKIEQTYFRSNDFVIQGSKKEFVLNVLGEVDSVIKFLTDTDLGVIKANFPSLLQLEAVTTVPKARLNYTIVDGNLPPGLSLSSNGNIIGKVNQFRADAISGFTIFDQGDTTFDNNELTIDRGYTFTVKVQDQFRFSALTKEFKLTVNGQSLTLYSNIYTKPFQKQTKRDIFYSFINDTNVFTPDRIYRLGDPQYGVQTDLKMLIYPGIESKAIAEYVAALSKNTKRKRLRLGSVKKAIAKMQGTDEILYEVIYIEAFDEYENANGSASAKIKLPGQYNSPIKVNQSRRNTVDGTLGTYNSSTGVTTYSSASVNSKMNDTSPGKLIPAGTPLTVDGKNVKISGNDLESVYPSTIRNIRKNLSEVGLTENEFLPLWMTTPQDNRTAATGFVNAVPLCYCKPGEGDYILQNIKNRNFDFSQIDYEIDRLIIDSDLTTVQEQYLKFANYRFNI